MSIYWGDLHTHCGITYGYGSLENALIAAEKQLDFCAIIGHAMWPDIPENNEDLEYLVSYHKNGFKKLAENWEYVRKTVNKANQPEEFITFQGYEIHSREHGDHHIVSPDSNLPLLNDADSPHNLIKKLEPHKVIAIPHHIGYTPGYRGINWDTFSSEISPIVEVYSKHGSSVSDKSMYKFLHTMGPRDSRNTVMSGLKQGNKFGFAASTDHHAGYPGSYGDGRIAVIAEEKTRDAIYNSILSKKTYAVTGDKIKCEFRINEGTIGDEIDAGKKKNINFNIEACDYLDKIVLYKNMKPGKIINGEFLNNSKKINKYKIRMEMGWGHDDTPYKWEGLAQINDGKLTSIEPCFRGRNVLAPDSKLKNTKNINRLNNKIIEKTEKEVSWQCTTFKNPSTRHSQTNSLLLELEGDENTEINLSINGVKKSYNIERLLQGSLSTHIESYNSEAFVVHQALPENKYNIKLNWEDSTKEKPVDNYFVEIRQKNNQMAWITPIYVRN
ncbi:MAG: hypothetical protein ACOC4G_08035 [Bacillota bacterium]